MTDRRPKVGNRIRFVKKLKDFKKHHKLTYSDIARASGLSLAAPSLWFGGHCLPTFSSIDSVERGLMAKTGHSVKGFFVGTDPLRGMEKKRTYTKRAAPQKHYPKKAAPQKEESKTFSYETGNVDFAAYLLAVGGEIQSVQKKSMMKPARFTINHLSSGELLNDYRNFKRVMVSPGVLFGYRNALHANHS